MPANLTEISSRNSKYDAFLLEPYDYLTQQKGKRFRTQLIEAFNYWLKVPEDVCQIIEDTIEMLHNASILIDDIEDNSTLRRGVPVAQNIFGIATTINCANYVYFLTLHKLVTELPQDKVQAAVKVFTEQMLDLHRGQGMEIHWRDTYLCPSEEEYLIMVGLKTGGLFRLAINLLQLFSENKNDLSEMAILLGKLFQIRDDLANLTSKEYADNKTFCEDFTEGKFSFPIIHAIKSHPENNTIMNIIRRRTNDYHAKRFACQLLEDFGSFKYTEQVIIELYNKIKKEIDSLGGNSHMDQLLDYLLKSVK